MTERIAERFDCLAARRRTGLAAYALAGDPDPAQGRDALRALAVHADLLEIGVPCRDPMRDGPTIRAAHGRARAAGADWTTAIAGAADIRRRCPDLPILLLLYAETVREAGPGPLFQAAAAAGVDALLVVDLPEAGLPWWPPMAAMTGLGLVPIVGPGMDDEMLRQRLSGEPPFVYCAGAAVTGGDAPDVERASSFLERVQNFTSVPRVLGFGIRTPDLARRMAPLAEGLAVGTAFVAAVEVAVGSGTDPSGAIGTLAQDFSRAMREAR